MSAPNFVNDPMFAQRRALMRKIRTAIVKASAKTHIMAYQPIDLTDLVDNYAYINERGNLVENVNIYANSAAMQQNAYLLRVQIEQYNNPDFAQVMVLDHDHRVVKVGEFDTDLSYDEMPDFGELMLHYAPNRSDYTSYPLDKFLNDLTQTVKTLYRLR